MRFAIFFTLFFSTSALFSQRIVFLPETVVGNRSLSYQHNVFVPITNKFSFSNFSYFDIEHTGYERNLYVIRNTVSYGLSSHFQVNAIAGIKNPGAFASLNLQYTLRSPVFYLSTFVGPQYLKQFTIEHFIMVQFKAPLSFETNLFLKAQSSLYFNNKGIARGIEQVRIGVDWRKYGMGLAGNFDHWNNAETTISNLGLYFKYSIE